MSWPLFFIVAACWFYTGYTVGCIQTRKKAIKELDAMQERLDNFFKLLKERRADDAEG